MDLKDWQGWVGAGLLAALTFIFGKAKYKRDESADKVEETRNQAESNLVLRLEAEVKRQTLRADLAMQDAQVNKELFFSEQSRAKKLELVILDNEYRINSLDRDNKQLRQRFEKLADIVSGLHPSSSEQIKESMFGDL